MTKSPDSLLRSLFVALLIIFSAGSSFVAAQPSSAPPTSSTPLPINDTSKGQTKSGAVSFNQNLDVAQNINVTGEIQTPELCLNGECKTTWEIIAGSLWADSSPNLYYNGSGNVGIGTTTPTEELDVIGNIKTTSYTMQDICFENEGCYSEWGAPNYETSVSAYFNTQDPAAARFLTFETNKYCKDEDGCHMRVVMDFRNGSGQREKAHRMYDIAITANGSDDRWRVHQPGGGEWTVIDGDPNRQNLIDAWVCDIRDNYNSSAGDNAIATYFVVTGTYAGATTTCTLSIYD